MHMIRKQQLFSTLAIALLLAGCGNMPVTPTADGLFGGMPAVQQQVTAHLPSGVSAKTIAINPAKATTQVGASSTLQATITGSDGQTYADPRLVTWSVSDPSLGTIDQNGVLTPLNAGTAQISASIGTVSATATIQIQPAQFGWQQMPSPAHADLRAVKVLNQFEAWAGGDAGTLIHYVNGAWFNDLSFHQLDAHIRGIDFANSALGWAVGSRGNGNIPLIARYAGGFWRMDTLPVNTGSLNTVSVINAHNAWAAGVGGDGDALLLHWDGMSWKQAQSPAAGTIDSIQMLGENAGWAVGKYSDDAHLPLIFKYVKGAWEKRGFLYNHDDYSLTSSLELTGIKMVSETQGYAVGIRDPFLMKARGLFLQNDPKNDSFGAAHYDAANPNLDQVPLHAIGMISGSQGWALGETRQPGFTLDRNPRSIFGNLLENNGGVLSPETNYFAANVSQPFYAIDVRPQGDGFVVGGAGFILQRSFNWRGAVNPAPLPTPAAASSVVQPSN
jgi:hypothetical protein